MYNLCVLRFVTVPSQPPSDVTHVTSDDSVMFPWEEVPCGSRGGLIHSYEYKLSSNGNVVESGNIPSPTQQVTLDRPSCGSYMFEVAALNDDGMSDYAAIPYDVIDIGRSMLIVNTG